MRAAITKQKRFYIDKLLQTGLFHDSATLKQWTVSELRREYEQYEYGIRMKKRGE
ncbi:Fur-regulated basic protein FbpA [Geobacillus sp. NFOSA3]|nr:Fur-regulated basic protein FbpA [Geobacillus sp. NFOSA3]